MGEVKKVSIIIPVYNTGNKLCRCLDSVLAQSYQDYECIVVDDGSTDDSSTIIDEYAIRDTRFKVVHKENGGVSSARNYGLNIASGEWLVFIDSDDSLMPDHIASLMDAATDDVDLVMTGFRFLHPDKTTEHGYNIGKYVMSIRSLSIKAPGWRTLKIYLMFFGIVGLVLYIVFLYKIILGVCKYVDSPSRDFALNCIIIFWIVRV